MNSLLTSILLPACMLALPLPAAACTLWAAAGTEVDGGGTLIAKNRDWQPDHQQRLRFVRPSGGHAFLGLYAEGNAAPGLKAGINDTGLAIISASSNIPTKMRKQQPGKRAIMATILRNYGSIEELAGDADRLFESARAGFFMLSDHSQLMLVEVALDGRHSIRIIREGYLTHTNHYLDATLAGQFGDHPGISSSTRYARINELLAQGAKPFDLGAFATYSRDRTAGPDNSLWRSGREYTLASWIVAIPPRGAPNLRVVITNPGEAEETREITLDAAFWQTAH